MADRDTAFVDFVARERPLLLGAALLMHGSRAVAEDVVAATLARTYLAWSGPDEASRTSLRRILSGDHPPLDQPWRQGERFELIDRVTADAARVDPAARILADLATLDAESRRVVILVGYLGRTLPEVAAALAMDPERAGRLLAGAVGRLADRDPDREAPSMLTQQLRSAVATTLPAPPTSAQEDLGHGRQLLRRRRLRSLLVAVVVVVLGGLAAAQLVSPPATTPVAGLPAVSTAPARSAARCNPRDQGCELELVRAWRNTVSRIAVSHLDPDRSYFSGYTFSYDGSYDTPSFWRGEGGVLALDLVRLDGGSTEVYLQIASSVEHAARCGRRTRHSCRPMEDLEGRVFTVTDTSTVAAGMEAQYDVSGGDVITVVARNTSGGRPLAITQGQLRRLVSDPRLRLPEL